jgi:hypothetical protein
MSSRHMLKLANFSKRGSTALDLAAADLNRNGAEQVASQIRDAGAAAIGVQIDVTDPM